MFLWCSYYNSGTFSERLQQKTFKENYLMNVSLLAGEKTFIEAGNAPIA